MKRYCRECNERRKVLVELRPSTAMIRNNLVPCGKCPECGHSVMSEKIERALGAKGSVYHF